MFTSCNSKRLPKIGITQGDINGIGYEVILKTLIDPRIFEFFIPIIYGQSKVFSYYKKNLGMENLTYSVIKDVFQAQPRRINIINHTDEELKVEPGFSTEVAGKASFEALKIAVKDLYKNDIDILVTAPINKQNIQSNKFHFRGQTEYIESFSKGYESLMLMICDKLRVGMVTSHISIKEVPDIITKELIIRKLKIMNQTLKKDFNITYPRIAVMGLNPHSGDTGLIGKEEIDVIKPAIEYAKNNGILSFGPYPADGFFGTGSWTKYDGILSMYHDQAMIPFKILAVNGGVNFTAGLNVIRTSPAHGTGYDIANKDIADPNSFRHAIFLAIDIMRNRGK